MSERTTAERIRHMYHRDLEEVSAAFLAAPEIFIDAMTHACSILARVKGHVPVDVVDEGQIAYMVESLDDAVEMLIGKTATDHWAEKTARVKELADYLEEAIRAQGKKDD